MRNFFSLFAVFFRINMLNEAAYRANFFFQILESLINLATLVILVETVFSYTHSLAGWRAADLFILVGIYVLIGGIVGLVIMPSMQRFMGDIRQGTLDYTLLKPVDAQSLVSIQELEIWRLADVVMGACIIAWGLLTGGLHVGWIEAGAFIITLLAGCVIVYSFILILSTLSFWYVKVENILVIFMSMYDAGRWPVTVYPSWLRTILTFVVPIAFAITVPAQALTNQLTWLLLMGAIALAVVLFIVSRAFWLFGVRHYSSASS